MIVFSVSSDGGSMWGQCGWVDVTQSNFPLNGQLHKSICIDFYGQIYVQIVAQEHVCIVVISVIYGQIYVQIYVQLVAQEHVHL